MCGEAQPPPSEHDGPAERSSENQGQRHTPMTDERIEFYKQAIEKMPGLGESLLERLCAQKDAIPRNVIVTIFVRKGTRLVKAVGCLLENSLVEESQVLCRVLFETMVTFEYFLKLAKDDYDGG